MYFIFTHVCERVHLVNEGVKRDMKEGLICLVQANDKTHTGAGSLCGVKHFRLV